MTADLPQVAGGLEAYETDDGLVVYQEMADRVHHLNHTAAVILDLCDGTRSPEEIAESVGQIFGLPETPTTETGDCLAHLAREHLIQ